MIPGEYFLDENNIILNEELEYIELIVQNKSERPIQIGSHFHFFEVNRELIFERKKTFGKRLDIPSGSAVRFEPGEKKLVKLIPIGGKRYIYGFNGLANGPVNNEYLEKSLIKATNNNFIKE
jgi:urease beta subunit